MPPHITVLYPFVRRRRVDARLIAGLIEAFGCHPAFDFELTTVGRFPHVLYLSPEPAQPFRDLIEECTERWPRHPPYGGAFPDAIPHLTLSTGPEPAGLAERATSLLPIPARATEVWLMEWTRREGWRQVVRLPLSDVRRTPG
jgi:2'-5' RNA ligase